LNKEDLANAMICLEKALKEYPGRTGSTLETGDKKHEPRQDALS
jgi:hypothetical protein